MLKKLRDILNSYEEKDLEIIGLFIDDVNIDVNFIILDENDNIILVTKNTDVSVAGHNL